MHCFSAFDLCLVVENSRPRFAHRGYFCRAPSCYMEYTRCASPTADMCAVHSCYEMLRSQSKTMRRAGDVLGDESVQSVKDANRMLWRVVALLLICSAKGVFWILEQPERSLMESHPALQLLFGCVRCYRVSIQMEDFGAKSKKPTWLYSSASSAHTESACK